MLFIFKASERYFAPWACVWLCSFSKKRMIINSIFHKSTKRNKEITHCKIFQSCIAFQSLSQGFKREIVIFRTITLKRVIIDENGRKKNEVDTYCHCFYWWIVWQKRFHIWVHVLLVCCLIFCSIKMSWLSCRGTQSTPNGEQPDIISDGKFGSFHCFFFDKTIFGGPLTKWFTLISR